MEGAAVSETPLTRIGPLGIKGRFSFVEVAIGRCGKAGRVSLKYTFTDSSKSGAEGAAPKERVCQSMRDGSPDTTSSLGECIV